MRYGILADIHSNLEALEAVIEACRQEGVRSFFCVGDIVGYGANPNECVDRVLHLKATMVAGNHDLAVAGEMDFSHFNSVAQKAVVWTQQHIAPKYVESLAGLSLTFKNSEFIMVHATLNKPEEFIYITDMSQAADTFYLMDRNICFTGHTHVPRVLVQRPDQMEYLNPRYVALNNADHYIVNVGSVGQPRDGNPHASFCIYDPDLERLEVRRIPYAVERAQQKILEAGLPDILAQRLAVGQ
jgi:predicted phosphodiesterase